jgi:hypothetical protein
MKQGRTAEEKGRDGGRDEEGPPEESGGKCGERVAKDLRSGAVPGGVMTVFELGFALGPICVDEVFSVC